MAASVSKGHIHGLNMAAYLKENAGVFDRNEGGRTQMKVDDLDTYFATWYRICPHT